MEMYETNIHGWEESNLSSSIGQERHASDLPNKNSPEGLEHHTVMPTGAASLDSTGNDVIANREVKSSNDNRKLSSSSAGNLNALHLHDESLEDADGYATFPRARHKKVDRYGFVIDQEKHHIVASSLPRSTIGAEIGKRREMKWLKMLRDWDVYTPKHHEKVKERCRKGIPSSLRSLVWQHLTGAYKLQKEHSDLYQQLTRTQNAKWLSVIEKDIPRTFRHHCMFHEQGSDGQQHLMEVLLAYSVYDPEIGYNQAMAPVAAVLLMHMTPEETFWVLVAICRFYVPGYYGENMEAMRLDGMIFDRLLEVVHPYISKHMKKLRIDPLMYIVEWMVCIYARCLPFESVLRIWDIFFCEGIKVLFRVGLTILKLVFPTSKDLEGKDDYATTQCLANLPADIMCDKVLIPETLNLKLQGKDIERIHKKIIQENPDLKLTRFTGLR